MDHSVKAASDARRLARLLNRHRFENDELESLYRRYTFKLQHASVASCLALFAVLAGVLANLGGAYAHAPTPQNLYHGAHCVLFVGMFVLLRSRLLHDACLLWLCYAVLFFCATFCAVALPVGETPTTGAATGLRSETRRVAAEGVWQVVFAVFLAYAMLPLRTWVAALFGVSLPIVHMAVAGAVARDLFPHLVWQQVSRCQLTIDNFMSIRP